MNVKHLSCYCLFYANFSHFFRLKIVSLCCFVALFVACSNENDSLVPTVEPENSGFIRTVNFINSDLIINDVNGIFGVNLEVEDGANGSLLDNIEIFTRFKRNFDTANDSSSEILLKTLDKEKFSTGPNGLPRTVLEITYAELIEETNGNTVECGDQFLIRLQLNLNNGKSFSMNSKNSPAVIGFDTTISSPFSYTINIVKPIPEEHFMGAYRYESVIDGPLGPTFGASKVVELQKGNSVNDRYFEGDYIASRSNEPSRKFRFIFTCDGVVFRKNQISSFFTWCPEGNLSGGITFGGSPILLGPGNEVGITSMGDDSSFELSIVEGYEGWDGECGFGTVNAKIRFTKIEQ